MLSDILSELKKQVEHYQRNFPEVYKAYTKEIEEFKAKAEALRIKLDTPFPEAIIKFNNINTLTPCPICGKGYISGCHKILESETWPSLFIADSDNPICEECGFKYYREMSEMVAHWFNERFDPNRTSFPEDYELDDYQSKQEEVAIKIIEAIARTKTKEAVEELLRSSLGEYITIDNPEIQRLLQAA